MSSHRPRHPDDHFVVDYAVLTANAYRGMGPRTFAELTGEPDPSSLLARWRDDERVGIVECPRLVVAMEVWDAVIADGLTPEQTRAWMVEPSLHLGRLTPAAALRAGASRKDVLAAAKVLS